MNLAATRTVRELALEAPGATRVFERYGIDYCCGGNKSLQDACAASNLELEKIVQSLESALSEDNSREAQPFASGSLAELMEHIRQKHHKYTREESVRLGALFEKVCSVHGARHVELLHARDEFRNLARDLSTHMMKEEIVLFPYIERMEEAVMEGGPILPAPFGTVQNPVAAMAREHDSAGDLLRRLRSLTNGYTPPADACVSYQTLYSALEEFERDLHQHIHLENNILFPRAIEMERGRQSLVTVTVPSV